MFTLFDRTGTQIRAWHRPHHARFRKSARAYKICDASRNVTSVNTKSPYAGKGHKGAKRIGTAQKTARKLVGETANFPTY